MAVTGPAADAPARESLMPLLALGDELDAPRTAAHTLLLYQERYLQVFRKPLADIPQFDSSVIWCREDLSPAEGIDAVDLSPVSIRLTERPMTRADVEERKCAILTPDSD